MCYCQDIRNDHDGGKQFNNVQDLPKMMQKRLTKRKTISSMPKCVHVYVICVQAISTSFCLVFLSFFFFTPLTMQQMYSLSFFLIAIKYICMHGCRNRKDEPLQFLSFYARLLRLFQNFISFNKIKKKQLIEQVLQWEMYLLLIVVKN